MNDITIGVNTKYKQFKKEFLIAHLKKQVVNNLLEICGLPIYEISTFFLDFDGSLIICHSKNMKKYYVDKVVYF
jgi:hypothetical protein